MQFRSLPANRVRRRGSAQKEGNWFGRRTTFWKLNFFLHAFFGALLTVYLIVIGISGSILVFRNELQAWSREAWTSDGLCSPSTSVGQKTKLSLPEVVASLQNRLGKTRLLSVDTPTRYNSCYEATMLGPRGRIHFAVNGQTGTIGERKNVATVLHRLSELHATLWAGRNGRTANGVGAILLLLVNLSGLVIWWNGTQLWRRGLRIDWRRQWRRVTFDSHRAVGFWTVAIISFWAVSGVYFAWPEVTTRAINRFSPLQSARPPVVHVGTLTVPTTASASIANIIEKAKKLDEGATLAGIRFPASRRAPFEVLLERPEGEGPAYADTLYFDPADGSYIQIWRYGRNKSWGDLVLWIQIPLHFGTAWGLPFKILWASLGLSVPMLALSGAVLYWNRVLRHQWSVNATRRRKSLTLLAAAAAAEDPHASAQIRQAHDSSTPCTSPADQA